MPLAVTVLAVPTAADAKLAVPLHVTISAPTMPVSVQPVSVALKANEAREAKKR